MTKSAAARRRRRQKVAAEARMYRQQSGSNVGTRSSNATVVSSQQAVRTANQPPRRVRRSRGVVAVPATGMLVPTDLGTEYGPSQQRMFQMFRKNPYMAMLISPKYFHMRMPDDYSRPTALYISYTYFDVIGNNSNGTAAQDKGKFAYIFRPVLSSTNALAVGGKFCAQTLYYPNTLNWTIANLVNSADWSANIDPNEQIMLGTNTAGGFTSYGLVRDYRPVAMSVWFQFNANVLNSGGQVAMAQLDGSIISQYFEPNPAPPGELAEYRNLAAVDYAYNGAIPSGCYGFWTPWDTGDSVFYVPYGIPPASGAAGITSAEQYPFPCLVISGQSSITDGSIIGRIECVRVFEYTTSSRVPDVVPSPVDPGLITEARMLLQNEPNCMANDDHMDFIQSMLSKVPPSLKTAAKIAAPAIGFAAGRALGGPFGGIRGAVTTSRVVRSLLNGN